MWKFASLFSGLVQGMRKVNIKNKKEDSDESKGGFCKNQVEVRIFFVKTTLVFLPMNADFKEIRNGVDDNVIFECYG